jgi:hypothetical protein
MHMRCKAAPVQLSGRRWLVECSGAILERTDHIMVCCPSRPGLALAVNDLL